jgi:hypothetical protein
MAMMTRALQEPQHMRCKFEAGLGILQLANSFA